MTEFADGSGISWTICKQSAPRCRQITTPTPHHSIFTGRMLFLVHRVSKHWIRLVLIVQLYFQANVECCIRWTNPFQFFVRVLVFILAHLKRWCLSDFVILALVSLEERLWHDPFLCRMVHSHFTPSIGSPVCYLHSHIMWQDLCNSTVSVHLPVCPIYQPLQQQVCCCGPSRQEISIGHCRSTACSSKGEQCHVVSWRMKLKTDLFKLFG